MVAREGLSEEMTFEQSGVRQVVIWGQVLQAARAGSS